MSTVPIPSGLPIDFKENVQRFDEVMTSDAHYYTDRFGVKRWTIAGFQYTAEEAIRSYGYITMDSFEDGATLTLPNQVLRYESTGEYYRWDGAFPKTVASASTPETTGGVGIGAWVSVGDATLRSDLANGEKAKIVGYDTPYSNQEITVNDALDKKYPSILGNVTTPATGLMFDSYETYTADHDIRFTNGGSTPLAIKRLKKTGNATVTLTSSMGTPVGPLTVDTVAYLNPAQPQPNSFPARTRIDGITFEGDDSGGQSGLTILQGHDFEINRVGFLKTKVALWMKEVWMTSVSNVIAWGQILHEAGTSSNYKTCFAKSTDTSVTAGAYRMINQQYGSMTGCASDGTVRTAYFFDNCNAFNITACGCEVPTNNIDIGLGVAAHFGAGNDMTITDFYTLPAPGTNILLSVQNANNLTFNNFIVFGALANYSRDMWIHGPGNTIIFNSCNFPNGQLPLIAVDAAAAGSKIIVNTPNNKYIHVVTAASNLITFEPFSLSSTLDTTTLITFGSSTTDIGGSPVKDIKMRKEGGLITVEFYIAIPSSGGQTGQLRLRGLPYASSDLASGSISQLAGVVSGTGQVGISMERGSNSIEFVKFGATTSTGTAILTNSDLSPGAVLRGSITYKTNTSFS